MVSWLGGVDAVEARRFAQLSECLRLLGRPAVAGMTGGAGLHAPLDGEEATAERQDPAHLGEPAAEVGPVVHGRQRPGDVHGVIRQREGLGRHLAAM